jgi:GNAT superfamily N-acetyltransferase
MTYFIMGYEYTWWRGDELPRLPPLDGFCSEPADDTQLLALLHNVDIPSIETRLSAGNTPYVAFLQDKPVAYGWSATKTVGIAEVGLEWRLTPDDRGLWDFVTLEGWRGRGIYPKLLQAILRAEEARAERFWIGHRADNDASKRGILKAGFQLSNIEVLTPDYQPRSVPRGNRQRALVSPLGKHLGLIEVDDKDMALFDFENADFVTRPRE